MDIQTFEILPAGEVFGHGVTVNSPEGVYMTDNNLGEELMWVAKKGYDNDWCIYIHWAYNGFHFVLEQGDKVAMERHIRKLVPCDDEVYKRYRW
jgi:hypothetical protein